MLCAEWTERRSGFTLPLFRKSGHSEEDYVDPLYPLHLCLHLHIYLSIQVRSREDLSRLIVNTVSTINHRSFTLLFPITFNDASALMWGKPNLALIFPEEHTFLGIFLSLNNSVKGSISHPHKWQEIVLLQFCAFLLSGQISGTLCNLRGQTSALMRRSCLRKTTVNMKHNSTPLHHIKIFNTISY